MKRTFKFLKLPITREVESFKLKFLKNCFLFEKIKNFMLEINFVSKKLFFLVLGKSPKLGQQPKLAQPNFGWANFFQILAGPKFDWAIYGWAKFWLGQFFPQYGWAKIWLGQLWLGHFFGWANFFHFLAGPKFGCWPSFGWAKWLGHILAGPILLDRYYGWAILAGLMAGSSIGPAKNLAQP